MSKECQHDGADIVTAIFADGLCPLCLQAEVEKLRKALTKIKYCCVYISKEDMQKEYERAWKKQTEIAEQALKGE